MMSVADAHKGVATFRTRVTGHEAHSARPALGANAVAIAGDIVSEIGRQARLLEAPELCDPRFDPAYSTLSVGTIHGGTARNILARECNFDWEFRGLPGVPAATAAARVQAFVDEVALPRLTRFVSGPTIVTTMEVDVPALAPQASNAAASLALRLTRSNTIGAVSFATEAGHFQAAGLPTVVCGPGSIEQAHKPDEFIAVSQIAAGVAFLRALAAELAGGERRRLGRERIAGEAASTAASSFVNSRQGKSSQPLDAASVCEARSTSFVSSRLSLSVGRSRSCPRPPRLGQLPLPLRVSVRRSMRSRHGVELGEQPLAPALLVIAARALDRAVFVEPVEHLDEPVDRGQFAVSDRLRREPQRRLEPRDLHSGMIELGLSPIIIQRLRHNLPHPLPRQPLIAPDSGIGDPRLDRDENAQTAKLARLGEAGSGRGEGGHGGRCGVRANGNFKIA